jgi:hypothetical protein
MANTTQCPSCRTVMPASARFCPKCGRPRTTTLAEIAQAADATGEDYATLLERAHAQDIVARSQAEVTSRRRRRRWTIGLLVGAVVLIVGCSGVSWLVYKASNAWCDTYSGPEVSSPDGRARAHAYTSGCDVNDVHPARVALTRGDGGTPVFVTTRGLDPRDITLTWRDDSHLRISYPTYIDGLGNQLPIVDRRDTTWRDVTIEYAPYDRDTSTPTSRTR